MSRYERARLQGWRDTGREAMDRAVGTNPLPWDFRGTVFRCTWEYPVDDFETEVGFHLETLGCTTLALDDRYALFTTRDRAFTFACRRSAEHANLAGHVLCFMTRDIAKFERALRERLPERAVTARSGSSVQRVLDLRSPAGLRLEIWEFPDA